MSDSRAGTTASLNEALKRLRPFKVVLRNGRRIRIRPVTPGDRQGIKRGWPG